MSRVLDFLKSFRSSSNYRKAGRAHLNVAKEDPEQFLGLVANYIDLAYTFYGSCHADPVEFRRERVSQLFLQLWRQLGYAERLSDFEFMLAQALIQSSDDEGRISSPEPMVTKVRLLSPRVRFALLAYEFEKWPIRWVKLVMRMRPQELHALLAEARCELCGVSWESLAEAERNCLIEICDAMDCCPDIAKNKAIHEQAKQFPRVMEIKAEWLELRPELVEVRLRFVPDQAEREAAMAAVLNAIDGVPIQRAPIVDRMVNTVHFSRHEPVEVSK